MFYGLVWSQKYSIIIFHILMPIVYIVEITLKYWKYDGWRNCLIWCKWSLYNQNYEVDCTLKSVLTFLILNVTKGVDRKKWKTCCYVTISIIIFELLSLSKLISWNSHYSSTLSDLASSDYFFFYNLKKWFGGKWTHFLH